jgi:hypothetical protein
MTSTEKQESFRSLIERYTARQIAEVIGCSLPTAYDWRSGRRSPPEWLRERYLGYLADQFPSNPK